MNAMASDLEEWLRLLRNSSRRSCASSFDFRCDGERDRKVVRRTLRSNFGARAGTVRATDTPSVRRFLGGDKQHRGDGK